MAIYVVAVIPYIFQNIDAFKFVSLILNSYDA